MARDDCNCDQETVVVFFIGPTQNGKSSLVRSILRTGGQEEQARAVNIGNGNVSMTKAVASYNIKVDLVEHSFRDESGKIVDIDENVELFDLTHSSEPSGKHAHLVLLDTPGLDDSDGGIQGNSTTHLPGLDADTEHKLSVLQALHQRTSVNAICFVEKFTSQLGNTFRGLMKQYVNVLKECDLHPSLHFVHTYVDSETRFGEVVKGRPRDVEKTGIFPPGALTHHFVNNCPDETIDIEQSLASMWLSSFLNSLVSKPACWTNSLRFPKPQALRDTEEQIRMALTAAISSLDQGLATNRRHRETVEQEKQILAIGLLRKRKECSESRAEIQQLDKKELVDIGTVSDYERPHTFSKSYASIRCETSIPIRERTITKSYGLSYNEILPTIGTKSIIVSGKTYDWCQTAELKVQLWGWKKEYYADRISRLKEDLKEGENDCNSLSKSFDECSSRLTKAQRDEDSIVSKLNQVRNDQTRMRSSDLSSTSLPLSTILNNKHLLSGSHAYRVSTTYALSARIPRRHLPGPGYKLSEVKNANERISDSLWASYNKYGLVKERISTERAKREALVARISKLKRQETGINAENTPETDIGVLSALSAMLEDVTIFPDSIRIALQEKLKLHEPQTKALHEEKEHRADTQNQIVAAMSDTLEALVESSRKLEEKWSLFHKRQNSIWHAAYQLKDVLTGDDDLNVGLYAMLRSAWKEVDYEYDCGALFREMYNPSKYPD